jgi:hypothetical protein
METTAYICDCCNTVFLEEYTVGLIVKPPELFNEKGKNEYDITNNLDKTNIHFSLSCHRKHVTDLLKGIDRSKDENEYKYSYNLYSNKFYERIYHNTILRNHTGNKRTKKLLQPLGKTTQ